MELMMIKVCTETFGKNKASNIETYSSLGGYSAWRTILADKTPKSEIIKIIKDSGLKGKGGAGFLTGLKWSFISPNNAVSLRSFQDPEQQRRTGCSIHFLLIIVNSMFKTEIINQH